MPKFVSYTIQAHIVSFPENSNEALFLALQRAADSKIYPNLWQVVTGNIEGGETAIETAIREIKEETSLKVKNIWTVPYVANFFNPYKNEIHCSPVFGFEVEYSEIVKISKEHQSYKWLAFKAILDILQFPSHIEGTKIFNNFVLNEKNINILKYKW
ncbi:MAG: NUDIX domain-containing protein [Ignavibacteria bacterium]|jgi:8-oxo-dGTP pyrophosphatase MutT (NUDIX family)|nr:NUDIX domain-containing protein [Ignavibacteria bacterium]